MDTEQDPNEMLSTPTLTTSYPHNSRSQFTTLQANSTKAIKQTKLHFNDTQDNNNDSNIKIMNSVPALSSLSPSISDELPATSPSVIFSMMQSMPFLMLGQQLARAMDATPTAPFSTSANNPISNQTDFSIDSILSSDNSSRSYLRSAQEYSLSCSNQMPHSLLLTTWLQSQQNQQQPQQNPQNLLQNRSSCFMSPFNSQSTYQYNNVPLEHDIFNPSLLSHSPVAPKPWFMNSTKSDNKPANSSLSNNCPNSTLYLDSKHDGFFKSLNDSTIKPGSSSPSIPTSSSAKRKTQNRGPRIPFTSHQVTELESKFSNAQYLSSLEVSQLAKRLNLTDNRIRIWFQNRRAREKREHRTTIPSMTAAAATAVTLTTVTTTKAAGQNETVTLSQSSDETVSKFFSQSGIRRTKFDDDIPAKRSDDCHPSRTDSADDIE